MSHDALEPALKSLLDEGRKIEAIKHYREQTGAGLPEAKAAVEALERGESMPDRPSERSDVEWDLISLLEQGREIDAIKLYREQTGSSLKQAKEAVERIAHERGLAIRSGCLRLVLFGIVGLFAGAAMAR